MPVLEKSIVSDEHYRTDKKELIKQVKDLLIAAQLRNEMGIGVEALFHVVDDLFEKYTVRKVK